MKPELIRCFGWLRAHDEMPCAARDNCKRFLTGAMGEHEYAERPTIDEHGVCLSYLPAKGDAANER